MNNETDAVVWATFNRFEISMSAADAASAHHQGECADDVAWLVKTPAIAKQLDAIDPDKIRAELKEYGCWDTDEMANDDDNRARIVWMAAGDITEEGATHE